MHVSTISLLYLQVGNCNQTTYQCPNCDNATQLVQPKHQQLVCPIPLTATKQPINNYTVTMQPAHLLQPKHQHQVCPIPLVCMNVEAKSCSQNMRIELMLQVTIISLIYSQGGNCNQRSQQHTNCENATHVAAQRSSCVCPIPLVCMKFGRKNSQNMGIGISLGSHHVTAVSSTRQLQAISLPASKL